MVVLRLGGLRACASTAPAPFPRCVAPLTNAFLCMQRDGPQEGSMAPLSKAHNVKVDKSKLTVNNDSNYNYCVAMADIGVR